MDRDAFLRAAAPRCADVRLCLLHGHAGLQPRQDIEILRTVILFVLGIHRQRKKYFRLVDAADGWHHFVVQLEFPGQHADDGARFSINRDASPHNVGVARE
jgi:hypothetical protein